MKVTPPPKVNKVTQSDSADEAKRPQPWADLPDRTALFDLHPVKTRDFHFPTPPVVRATDIITHTISSGAPSCAFYGPPRVGKSWAVAYSQRMLREAFPRLPFVNFCAHHTVRPNRGAFFRLLMTQNAYEGPPPRRGVNEHEQVVRAWWVQAQSRQSSTIVLFADEMQRLGENEYTWLIDLSNDLHGLGLRLVTILFGQPELASLRGAFSKNYRGDIVGRFMSRLRPFDGIGSATDLHRVFSFYDDPEHGEYPVGSGWCFTRFFLPQAYESGWRLASCAGLCWELFSKHAKARLELAPLRSKLSIGMEWIASTIQYVLLYYGDNDHPRFAISAKQWDKAIERSDFEESVVMNYQQE